MWAGEDGLFIGTSGASRRGFLPLVLAPSLERSVNSDVLDRRGVRCCGELLDADQLSCHLRQGHHDSLLRPERLVCDVTSIFAPFTLNALNGQHSNSDRLSSRIVANDDTSQRSNSPTRSFARALASSSTPSPAHSSRPSHLSSTGKSASAASRFTSSSPSL